MTFVDFKFGSLLIVGPSCYMPLIRVTRSPKQGSLPHTGSLYMSQVLELECRAYGGFKFTYPPFTVSLDHNKVFYFIVSHPSGCRA
jgi:hypothetical protein